MKAGAGPYIMATHAAPAEQHPPLPLPHHISSPPCIHRIRHTCAHWNCVFKSVNHENGHKYIYMCVFVSVCVHVCVFVLSLVLFLPLWRAGETAFSSISKFRTLQSAGRGYLNISLKCGSSFRLSPFSFLFFSSPHNVTPSTIKCTFVCVSLIYLCLFLRLSHKMSSQKASSRKLFVCCRVVNCRRPLQLFLVSRESFCICLII